MLLKTHRQAALLLAPVVGTVMWGACGPAFGQDRPVNGERDLGQKSAGGLSSSSWTFVDVTDDLGLVVAPGMVTESVAWGDYDNDGDPDLYLSNDGPNQLFRNDGGLNFVDVTAETGTGHSGHGKGVVFVDLDNDGDLDLFVVNDFGEPDVLYRNDGPSPTGGHVFTDVAVSAGVASSETTNGVAVFDYNLDGRLDIFVSGVEGGTLLSNLGDMQFSGQVLPFSSGLGSGAGTLATDFDDNAWPDIVIAESSEGLSRFFFDNAGQYHDMVDARGVAVTGSWSGVVAFDYDGDEDMDLFLGAWPSEGRLPRSDRLLRNNGGGVFEIVTTSAGVGDTLNYAMGAAVADVNLDGRMDLFVASSDLGSSRASKLFINEGPGIDGEVQFSNVMPDAVANGDHRGVAFADVDGDGDSDLLITGGANTGTRLYRNTLDHGGSHFLQVRLIGRQSSRSAVGARVRVTAGGLTSVQEVSAGAGLGSQNEMPLTFGLGASTSIDAVDVFWPSGLMQTYETVGIDQYLVLREPLLPPDINRDGAINIEDVLKLIAVWGDCFDCLADADGDGVVGIGDLLLVLSQYGSCCRVDVDRPDWGDGQHDVTGLPMTDDGWTDLVAMFNHPDHYLDTRVVYVSSSSGSDVTGTVYAPDDPRVGSNPFEPAGAVQPYKTIAAAYGQVRAGKADILLLKRGDTWNESENVGGKSGAGFLEPIIIGAYGPLTDPRPKVSSIHTAGATPRFLVVTSLEMATDGDIWIQGDSVLYEDVFLSNIGQYVLHGTGGAISTNLWLRRCVAHTGRIFAADIDTFLVEECIFDDSRAAASYLNHNVYLNTSAVNGVSRRNISARAGGLGWRQRGGGRVENNLVMDNVRTLAANPQIEIGTTDLIVSAEVRNNVALYRREGFTFKRVNGGDVLGNLVAHQRADAGSGMSFKGSGWGGLLIEGNIVYDWPNSTAAMDLSHAPATSVTVRDNDLQQIRGGYVHNAFANSGIFFEGNRYYSTWQPDDWFTTGPYVEWIPSTGMALDRTDPAAPNHYPDPSRDIQSYMEDVLGYASFSSWSGALDAFMAEAIQQRRGSWRDEFTAYAVNAYIRAGFGISTEAP